MVKLSSLSVFYKMYFIKKQLFIISILLTIVNFADCMQQYAYSRIDNKLNNKDEYPKKLDSKAYNEWIDGKNHIHSKINGDINSSIELINITDISSISHSLNSCHIAYDKKEMIDQVALGCNFILKNYTSLERFYFCKKNQKIFADFKIFDLRKKQFGEFGYRLEKNFIGLEKGLANLDKVQLYETLSDNRYFQYAIDEIKNFHDICKFAVECVNHFTMMENIYDKAPNFDDIRSIFYTPNTIENLLKKLKIIEENIDFIEIFYLGEKGKFLFGENRNFTSHASAIELMKYKFCDIFTNKSSYNDVEQFWKKNMPLSTSLSDKVFNEKGKYILIQVQNFYSAYSYFASCIDAGSGLIKNILWHTTKAQKYKFIKPAEEFANVVSNILADWKYYKKIDNDMIKRGKLLQKEAQKYEKYVIEYLESDDKKYKKVMDKYKDLIYKFQIAINNFDKIQQNNIDEHDDSISTISTILSKKKQ